MAVSFSDLRYETLRLLNETDLSVVGEIATGNGATGSGGATYTISSNEGLLDYLIEGANEMCRSCCYQTATVALTTSTARVRSFADTVIWFPQIASIGGTALIHTGEPELYAYDTSYTLTTGTPTHWFRSGPYDIGLYKTPTSTVIVTLTGASTPTAILTGSGTYSFAPDDVLLKALPCYAASKLALKNFDDPSLVGRSFWKDWYDIARLTLWQQLDNSLKMSGGPFAVPPVQLGGK
jgi:hypothetical protein